MKNRKPTIGIIIVTYNASAFARLTFDSLARAKSNAPVGIIVVDNNSTERDCKTISEGATLLGDKINEVRFIRQTKNLGFAGGNNVGISEFLADESISHICLLNSDVIVSDFWLDRLLRFDKPIIGCVTNKADGEQCIPIDFELRRGDYPVDAPEVAYAKAFSSVQSFAEKRYRAFEDGLVNSDFTFFCALIHRDVFDRIGFLDEAFFPGGYEDDDYLIRARAAGFAPAVARDTFIFHWGSASFGQLSEDYFSENAKRNKAYLENKHGLSWQQRPEMPFVSFARDLEISVIHPERRSLQKPMIELYFERLRRIAAHFEYEYSYYKSAVRIIPPGAVPETVALQTVTAPSCRNLLNEWNTIQQSTRALLATGVRDPRRLAMSICRIKSYAQAIHDAAAFNFAANAGLASMQQKSITPSTRLDLNSTSHRDLYPHLWRTIRWAIKGLRFLMQPGGIVFFGGYPYPERLGDGYFQRVKLVDQVFPDRPRLYVEPLKVGVKSELVERPEPNVIVLRAGPGRLGRLALKVVTVLAAVRWRRIYFHSVLRMEDYRMGFLLHLPWLRKIVDIHGVVPEEFRMHDDYFSALLYERHETRAVRKAGLVIVVTEAMSDYLRQKYRDALRARAVTFPMFPNFAPNLIKRTYRQGRPVVVYAGGLQKWQQIPKMIDAIVRTVDHCQHRIYCPDPYKVREMLPESLHNRVIVASQGHAELINLLGECHYGFILREDIIVNRVACPTKLVEYLAMGIVPIVDCDEIGDFKAIGMRFIGLNDLLNQRLPDEIERQAMALQNYQVYRRLLEVRQTGAREIHDFFHGHTMFAARRQGGGSYLRRCLPRHTLRGKLAHYAWDALRHGGGMRLFLSPGRAATPASLNPQPATCDLLMQVNNFEAGGLENVVIDLCASLHRDNNKVALLVLGKPGAALERVRQLGPPVICDAFDEATYAARLDRLRPKVVLSHYSPAGAELCARRGIPVVQVVHNIYMWFDASQQREFARAAEVTSTFVMVSPSVEGYSLARLGVPKEKSVVIANGIDFARFDALDRQAKRRELRYRHDVAHDEFLFLDIGSINHQKNHIGTLRAFEIAAASCPKARLLVLGPVYEPALFAELKAAIVSSPFRGRIIYAGATQEAEAYYFAADAFVAASFFEGCQLSFLEAVKADLPIASANVGIAAEYRGKPGFDIVDPAIDMLTYRGSISQMMSTPEFEARLAAAMVRTCRNPVRPALTADALKKLDRNHAYAAYKSVIARLMATARKQAPRTSEPERLTAFPRACVG